SKSEKTFEDHDHRDDARLDLAGNEKQERLADHGTQQRIGKEIAPGYLTRPRHGSLDHSPSHAAKPAQQADPECHAEGVRLEAGSETRERRHQTPGEAEKNEAEAASQRLDRLPEPALALVDLLCGIGKDSCQITQSVIALGDIAKPEPGGIVIAAPQ